MMRLAALLGISCAALAGAASAAEGPVGRLDSTSATEQAAAIDEIVAAGEKYIPDIESAYARPGEDRREFRERCRAVVARIRAAQVRKWAVESAPGLEKKLDWEALRRNLVWLAKPATAADARKSLCRISRSVDDWPEDEAVKLLKLCLADEDAAVREAAAWALDRPAWTGPAIGLLASALSDEAEKVRAAAGAVLIARGDRRGLAAVLAGAASGDTAVRDQCAATLPALIIAEDGQAQRLLFKHTSEDVTALTKLLTLKDMESRGLVARLLGLIGDKSAGPALLDALGKEPFAKNRRRIAISLGQLRHRPAAAALVELLKSLDQKLRTERYDYGWGVAGAWAQIGDPDTVSAMIEMLGDAKLAPYAAAGLSWAFGLPGSEQDYARGDGPGEMLVPVLASEGRLDRQWTEKAPKPEELKKLWDGFWAVNKAKYEWSDDASTMRYNIRPHAVVWPPVPLPGMKTDGVATGRKGEWVEIPITVHGKRCRINGVAVDRTNGDVYIVPMLGALHEVGCGRGVWKSRDRGATFEKTGENDTAGGAGCWSSMDMDPAGGRLCVFSMYGAVAMTLDGGATWRRFTSISEATTDWGAVDWDDTKAQTVMQTNHERSPGQHVSSDGGRTWQGLNPDFSYKTGLGVFDARTILHVESDRILRSEDLGKTWTPVAIEGLKLRTIVMRKCGGVGYLLSEKGLLASADKGKTWLVQGSPVGDATVFAGPYFGRDDRHVLVVGRAGVHESTDGGKTWKTAVALPAAFLDKSLVKTTMNPNYIEGTSLGYDPKTDVFYASLSGFPSLYRYER